MLPLIAKQSLRYAIAELFITTLVNGHEVVAAVSLLDPFLNPSWWHEKLLKLRNAYSTKSWNTLKHDSWKNHLLLLWHSRDACSECEIIFCAGNDNLKICHHLYFVINKLLLFLTLYLDLILRTFATLLWLKIPL